MKKIMLTICDSERAIHDVSHGGVIATMVPALGADPETIAELERALRRHVSSNRHARHLRNWSVGTAYTPAADGICMIDLPGRLVAYEWNCPEIGTSGVFECKVAPSNEVRSYPYYLSAEWLLKKGVDDWDTLVDQRRQDRAERFLPGARDVLYNEVIKHIVDACLAARGTDAETSIVDIHRDWLMTPRSDLHGQTPRQVIMADLQHIEMDVQLLAMRMAETGEVPPTLERTSHAYRYAGMGNHEWILYYDLVRFLITEGQNQVRDNPHAVPAALQQRLEQLAQEWLAIPKEDYHNHSPAELVDKERRREPLVLSGSAAVVDHDCPLCQMMADDMGPCFWHLDDSHMEHEFVFSSCQTLDQWDERQRQWQEMDRRIKADSDVISRENTKFSTVLGPPQHAEPSPPIWDRSFVDADPNDQSVPMEFVLFGIGACLAELGMDLKKDAATAPLVAQLNRDFGNLRETIRDSHELVVPVVERFRDNLNQVVELCPTLTDKCVDLEDQLQRLAARVNAVDE